MWRPWGTPKGELRYSVSCHCGWASNISLLPSVYSPLWRVVNFSTWSAPADLFPVLCPAHAQHSGLPWAPHTHLPCGRWRPAWLEARSEAAGAASVGGTSWALGSAAGTLAGRVQPERRHVPAPLQGKGGECSYPGPASHTPCWVWPCSVP